MSGRISHEGGAVEGLVMVVGWGIKANLKRPSPSKWGFLHLKKKLLQINLKTIFLLIPLVHQAAVSSHEL